jgi:hypothetical protein
MARSLDDRITGWVHGYESGREGEEEEARPNRYADKGDSLVDALLSTLDS